MQKSIRPFHTIIFSIVWRLLLSLSLILSSGCASMNQRKQLEAFNRLYSSAQYQQAADSQIDLKSSDETDPEDLLVTLQAATALRYAQQFEQSNTLFDQSEAILKQHNQRLLLGETASTMGSIMFNDAVLDYTGTAYDGIMTNTYKALNFWQLGNKPLARVEFNRALDRQRRAKEHFAQEIAQQQQAIAAKQARDGIDYQKNLNNSEIDRILHKSYSNLYNFAVYPDFINPFTTYMAGLFFLYDGDYAKAVDILKEAYGMLPEQTVVQDDFIYAQKMAQGAQPSGKYVWVIFENGMAPKKEEFRIDLPTFLFSRHVYYVGIALPKLTLQNSAYPYLRVQSNPRQAVQTKPLASMDRVIQTEFKKQYPWIVSRALMSALVKTTAQYFAQQQLGPWGGIAASLFQLATTSADIRIWSALPKEFQITKITTPEDGRIDIFTPDNQTIQLTLEPQQNHLIYIKIPKYQARIAYDVLTM